MGSAADEVCALLGTSLKDVLELVVSLLLEEHVEMAAHAVPSSSPITLTWPPSR